MNLLGLFKKAKPKNLISPERKIKELGLKRKTSFRNKMVNEAQLRELVSLGVSDVKIADKFHVYPATVLKWKKKLGIYIEDDERTALSKKALNFRNYYKKTGELPECPFKTNVLEKYKDDVISLLENGTPKLKIAKMYGVSDATVYNFIHLYGLRPPAKKICGIKEEILKEAFRTGKTIDLISKKIKCSPCTVRRAIKDLKLKRDPKLVRRKSPLNNQEERIKTLFYQGVPGTEIARQLGVTSTSIYAYLHKMKFDNSQRKVKRWTPFCAYDDELLKLRKDGMSLRKLAKHFGIHVNTVVYRIRRLEGGTKQNTRAPYRNPQSIKIDEIIRTLYQKGLKVSKIAQTINLSQGAIYSRLEKQNLPSTSKRGKSLLALKKGEIIAQYNDGNSIASIARRFHCTWLTIKKILIQEGVLHAKN